MLITRNTQILQNRQRLISFLNTNKLKLSSTNKPYEEVKIPMPWGHTAAKWWGPQNIRPIVVSHGWQDNCGSFDRLIPLLSKHISYLAIDFPGHGLSSQIPPGMYYFGIDASLLINRLMDYFGWQKVSLMGHSMGAVNNFVYAMLFPDTVDFAVCIDGLKPLIPTTDQVVKRLTKNIKEYLKYDALNLTNREPPSYTKEELIKRLHEGTRGSIALENCWYILERNVAPSRDNANKYYLQRDPRLKAGPISYWDQKHVVELAKRAKFPTLMIKSAGGIYFEEKKNFDEVFDVVQKVGKPCEYHEIEGTHHFHLNNPDKLADLINTFVKKYDVDDRKASGFKSELIASV